jgi:hypothetical protein
VGWLRGGVQPLGEREKGERVIDGAGYSANGLN